MLSPGSRAPDFSVKDQNGQTISLKEFKGKRVALFFYPQDNTPTCTEQACNLRDNIAALRKQGIAVIGVSMDSVRKHKSDEQKFSLPFPLLADVDRQLIDAYGVWGEKTLFGRTYMGIRRTTFLIGKAGIIEHVIDKVSAKDHASQILKTWGL
jgi:peroxiredoxin Q/BCP